MQSSVLERVLRAVPRLLVLTAPAGYLKTTTAFAYAQVFKSRQTIDLARIKRARDLLLALLQALSPQSGGDAYLRQAQLLLAAHEEVPVDLAERVLDAWREPGAPAAVVFDNAELLPPELLALLNEILERRPAYRTCIVCTAAPLALSSNVAPAAETMAIGAEALALGEEQTRELFAGTDITANQLLEVLSCAQGWPLLTLLLRHLHAEGRLMDALAGARRYQDAKSRYEFIQNWAIESLTAAQLRAIQFCASVSDAREADVRACAGQHRADALLALAPSFPLLSRHEGRLDVHSLLRDAVAAQSPHTREDLRAAARFALRRGDPVAAARRYLAYGNRDDVVKILDAMLERGATADVARVAALLDRETLQHHTRWFIITVFLRRYDAPPSDNLASTRAQREQLERTGDEMTRLAIGAVEAHQLLHSGQFALMEERLADLDLLVAQLKRGGIVNALRAHIAARFVDTLRAGLALARGETDGAERLLKRVRFMLGQFPMMNLSAVADGWLLIGLLRADLDLVRSQCARARVADADGPGHRASRFGRKRSLCGMGARR